MNFVCDDKILVSHALMMLMVGQMLGSLFGSAADIFGRKKLMVVCLFVHFVSSVLITVVGNIYSLGTVYLINGFALATAYCCSFTLIMEQVGLRWRHVVGIGCTAVWGIGMLFVGMLSYLLRDWRHLQLAASLPGVFFVFFTCLIPESARWLAEKGRYAEAEDILGRMAKGNGKNLTSKIHLRTETQGEEPHQKAQSLTMLLRCPPLLLRLAVVLFNWFVVLKL
ncbi:organic cation transporter protein [Plakobranchus ocellatus]|uniref:Organic cation transporter protein n=1 Tax=Plakobranchus ocellatus TaxID=259542 RepID=A0AAV4A9C5_9GAST|nr:organic cation transporter protein [Plakobranchus ocellatus]